MGNGGENARAVAGVGFAAARAAMVHALEHGQGIIDDLVIALALDVGDEPYAAGVVLVGGVVKTMGLGEAFADSRDGEVVVHAGFRG